MNDFVEIGEEMVVDKERVGVGDEEHQLEQALYMKKSKNKNTVVIQLL